MTPHDTIIVRLPYPYKIFGLTINIPKSFGFSFTNKYKHLMAFHNNWKNSKDYENWMKDRNSTELLNESLYFMAIAYCESNRRKVWFTKDRLKKAISLADEETQTKILNTWKASESFGATVKKKRTVTKKQ